MDHSRRSAGISHRDPRRRVPPAGGGTHETQGPVLGLRHRGEFINCLPARQGNANGIYTHCAAAYSVCGVSPSSVAVLENWPWSRDDGTETLKECSRDLSFRHLIPREPSRTLSSFTSEAELLWSYANVIQHILQLQMIENKTILLSLHSVE